uniref:Uncharacterized protein n=1 Tax=Anguilla anguilla TaxID=7936 RepID=A0A0E9WF77_ANGAN
MYSTLVGLLYIYMYISVMFYSIVHTSYCMQLKIICSYYSYIRQFLYKTGI